MKHSRAYLNFLDAAEVLRFRAQFGGHAFVNKKGAQYKCTVEYAPYQKVPRDKAKEDPREGTYENGQPAICAMSISQHVSSPTAKNACTVVACCQGI